MKKKKYNIKVENSVLLDGHGKLVAFGERATEMAESAPSRAREDTGDWLYVKHFKMGLHHCAADLAEVTVRAWNGREVKAEVVFTEP